MAKNKNNDQRRTYDVHLDDALLGIQEQVGHLHRNLRVADLPASFEYLKSWENHPARFMLDPALDLHCGEQYPMTGARGFGIFMDSAPDRWGRMLMERREAAAAFRENRPMKPLHEVDYLLGVHDHTRMGALRFRLGADGNFLDDLQQAAPPIASLAELAQISLKLEDTDTEKLPEYEKWLAMLIAPGTSLGGARPKANFTDTDRTLWFAKFPSKDDRHDIGGWEYLVHTLAKDAGIWVPDSRLMRFGNEHHTFCVRRFDRVGESRRMFVSAMTLLEMQDGETGGSYLDLVELLSDQGAHEHIGPDLEQLYRRVVFNVLVGNRDDHLRNHGFIRQQTGWRLAPAYDMNPNPHKVEHALTLDGKLAAPEMRAVRQSADFYRLSATQAAGIESEVATVVKTWRERALALGLPRFEVTRMAQVFQV